MNKLMEIKRTDVMLIQETHSTEDNMSDWKRAFNGEVILNHKSSLSGGVGDLFAKNFLPISLSVEQIVPGVFLKLKAVFDQVTLEFLNGDAPRQCGGQGSVFKHFK